MLTSKRAGERENRNKTYNKVNRNKNEIIERKQIYRFIYTVTLIWYLLLWSLQIKEGGSFFLEFALNIIQMEQNTEYETKKTISILQFIISLYLFILVCILVFVMFIYFTPSLLPSRLVTPSLIIPRYWLEQWKQW